MRPTDRDGPYRSHRFIVEPEGLAATGFSEVRGLSVSVGERSTDGAAPTTGGRQSIEERSDERNPDGTNPDGTKPDGTNSEDVTHAWIWRLLDPARWFDSRRDRCPPSNRRPTRSPSDRRPTRLPSDRRPTHSHSDQGPTRSRLVLERGLTDDRTLWDWFQGWTRGEIEPKDVSVYVLDERGEPARGWLFRATTPIRWRGPEFVADRAAIATETLELAHGGIRAVSGASIDRTEDDPNGRRDGSSTDHLRRHGRE